MYNEMEQPCPCSHCGEWFDLDDGCGSDKWYPNTVICEQCSSEEQEEIEEDERWQSINIELSNALYELSEEGRNLRKRLDQKNKDKILAIATLIK